MSTNKIKVKITQNKTNYGLKILTSHLCIFKNYALSLKDEYALVGIIDFSISK